MDSLRTNALSAATSVGDALARLADVIVDPSTQSADDAANDGVGSVIITKANFDAMDACRLRDSRLYNSMLYFFRSLMQLPPSDRVVLARALILEATLPA